jgi:hypothetical protein
MELVLALGFAMIAGTPVPDFTPPAPLFGAVLDNNTTEAKRVLAQGADPNQGRRIGSPAIFFQAKVENGADVQARDISDSTALLWEAFTEAGNSRAWVSIRTSGEE